MFNVTKSAGLSIYFFPCASQRILFFKSLMQLITVVILTSIVSESLKGPNCVIFSPYQPIALSEGAVSPVSCPVYQLKVFS